MTIDPTSSTPIGAIGPVYGGSGSAEIARRFDDLSTVIIGHVAASFGLLPAAAGHGDIYGLRALADSIDQTFGNGSAAEVGALTRAIEEFAGAVAADMAAFADGRTLDFAQQAVSISGLSAAGDLAGVIDALNVARRAMDGARQQPDPA
jgi:hypothetical protein